MCEDNIDIQDYTTEELLSELKRRIDELGDTIVGQGRLLNYKESEIRANRESYKSVKRNMERIPEWIRNLFGAW